MGERGRTTYREDTEGWTWGELGRHVGVCKEGLMSISRHASRGERLDGWDGLGFP